MPDERPDHPNYLAAWRKEKGLKQEQVANILGVDKSTIHRWETGKRAVDINDLNRLAAVYEVDPVALLLSPNDASLARQLTEARAILERISPEAGERWLATGRDIAGKLEK